MSEVFGAAMKLVQCGIVLASVAIALWLLTLPLFDALAHSNTLFGFLAIFVALFGPIYYGCQFADWLENRHWRKAAGLNTWTGRPLPPRFVDRDNRE